MWKIILKIYQQNAVHIYRTDNTFSESLIRITKAPKLPKNALAVTTDITGAYQIIPQDDESECLREALDEKEDKSIPSDFFVKHMDLIQKYNIFEFRNGMLRRHLIGIAM